MDYISRRLDLLKLEAIGLSKENIVDQLSQKYQCTPRTIYNDYETRPKWQPMLQGSQKAEDLLLKSLNRSEQIYAMASKIAISTEADYPKMAALRIMAETNSSSTEFVTIADILARLKVLEDKIAKDTSASKNS